MSGATAPQGGAVQLWLQITLAFVTLFNVACAWLVYRLVSESLPMKKAMRDLKATTANLESNFDALLESHARLRSRAGMRELRAREQTPRVETKAEARARIFGNKSGPAAARALMGLEDAGSPIRSA
jgi:hypothetical protein